MNSNTPHLPPESRDKFDPAVRNPFIDSDDAGSNRSARGWTHYVSWAVILGITLFLFGMNLLQPVFQKPVEEVSRSEMMNINIVSKMMVGQQGLAPAATDNSQQVATLNTGPLEQRYGLVLLLNELEGYEPAQELLEKIDEIVKKRDYKPTENQSRLREIVAALLDQYSRKNWDSSSIAKPDREFLTDQMGWVGRLGLTPKESPNAIGRQQLENEASFSVMAIFGACGFAALALFAGMFGLVLLSVLLSKGILTSPFHNYPTRSTIYIETFAIWLAMFVLIQYLLGFLVVLLEVENPLTTSYLTLMAFFGSLSVLIWPILRGISAGQVRRDIGWQIRNPFVEIGAGILAYASLLPVIGIAFLVVLVMMAIASAFQTTDSLAPTGGAVHPIQEQIANGGVGLWIAVLLTACVAAPIVEETMFRGVFYRHLRDISTSWARWGSVLFAAIVNALIFAAIHPQGLIGIPLLASLAIGMSLAREWRDSLIASMTMHAINNGLVTCLMFAVF